MIIFYLVFLFFTGIGLPVAIRIFKQRPTVAWVSARFFGLVLFGYLIWLLASIKLLNYQSINFITIIFLIFVAAGIYFSKSFLKNLFYQQNKKLVGQTALKKIITIETITFLAYLAYLYLRSHNGAINGTERFMDMAFLSASGKTDFFPFIDPWYAGHTVNYYYYGSYLMSLISNLSHTAYNLSYNFSLGLIYSQSLMLAGVLGYVLTKSKKLAILGALLVTTAGTLFFAGCTLKAGLGETVKQCSYASSTRLYSPSYIINEIPSYSFTVGDLHAHLLALPFFLFALLLIYQLAIEQKSSALLFGMLSVSLATSGMINAWDLITLGCLLFLVVVYKVWFAQNANNTKSLFAYLFICSLLIAFFMYPALRTFSSPVLGLGFIPSYVNLHQLSNVQWPTPLLAQIGIWGIFLIAIFAGLVFKRKSLKQNLFIAPAIVLTIGIIIGVEIIFIRDIYSVANPPYFRANTTFKFGYHAWTILSLVFVYCLSLFNKKILEEKFSKWMIVIAIFGGMVYPYQAVKQFYLNEKDKNIESLDGSKWMLTADVGDLETIKYINKNLKVRSVIAEAAGDSYTNYARISTFTGQIAPVGWQTHEWTWRFEGKNAKNILPGEQVETGWGKVSKVAGDIQKLYETNNLDEAKKILENYSIEFVYVGKLEREKYLNIFEEKFNQIGELVFKSGENSLYRVKKN
jgi:uncharacterized membrane protein